MALRTGRVAARVNTAVVDPAVLRGNAPLDWTDGAVAAYLKANFRKRVMRGQHKVQAAEDLVAAVGALEGKDCRVEGMSLALAVNYLARLSCTRKAFALFERFKHRGALKGDPRPLFNSLLLAACRSNEAGQVERVMRMAEAHFVSFTVEGWNTALRWAVLMKTRGRGGESLVQIRARMKAAGVELDLTSHHILFESYDVAEAEAVFARLVEQGGDMAPTQMTYHAMVRCMAVNTDRAKLREWILRLREAGHPSKTHSIAHSCLVLFRKERDYDAAYALYEDLLDNPIRTEPAEEPPRDLDSPPRPRTPAFSDDYALTSPLIAIFVSTMTEGSARAGDRCDRMVAMAFNTGMREGLLLDQLVLLTFLHHYAKVQSPALAKRVLEFMHSHNIKVTDLHRKVAKQAGSVDEDAPWARPDALTRNTDQLLFSIRHGRLAEVVPTLARLAKQAATTSDWHILADTALRVCATVLKDRVAVEAKGLTPRGTALLVIAAAVGCADALRHVGEPLRPAMLLRPLTSSDTALVAAEVTLAGILRAVGEADPGTPRQPRLSHLLAAVLPRQNDAELECTSAPLPSYLDRGLP